MWKFSIIATCSVIWAITASEVFYDKELGEKTSGACNTTAIGQNSSGFHSGAFNETTGVYCFWNFSSVGHNSVTLFFFNLYLHEDDVVVINNRDGKPIASPIKANNGSMAVITGNDFVFMELKGKDVSFIRSFRGIFSDDCRIAVPPDVKIIYSPTYAFNISSPAECFYRFDDVQHLRAIQVLTFEKFNMSAQSTVHIDGGTFSGDYKLATPVDIFNMADGKPLMLTITMEPNSTDYFKLNAHLVDKECSFYKLLESDVPPPPLKSPQAMLNNGSIVNECRWVFKHQDTSKIFGLKFGKLDFSSVFDIVAVNDGLGELSAPMLQVTTSNRNTSQNQVVRTSGPHLWISFKPIDYSSSFDANITIHGQGGYFRNNGTIEMKSTVGNDTVFLLEVEKGENVLLTFDDSSFSTPATLYVYDDFDQINLLTSLHGQVKFPVLSRSSRMMIIGKYFTNSSHFSAKFKGITPGCNHMSSLNTENYILSENCNSSCTWVIPPQDSPNSVLLLNLQYISLNEGDELKIHRLDADLTQLGLVTANQMHVPHIAVSANVGLLVNVTQGTCKEKKDKIVLIGHSSYMPDCNSTISLKPSEKYQISSPLYPDTYPLFTTCQWKISVKAGSFIHVTFENLKLAENHFVKIFHNSSSKTFEYNGKILPKDDLFLDGDATVKFDSTNCSKPQVGQMLNSNEGFLLNVTAIDCGAVLDGKKNGEFNTSISGNASICVWKVSVPPVDGNSVNIVSYTMSKKDKLENYELNVYDGSSVRDLRILNDTGVDVWSRTNSLIFVYMRLNISQSSSVLVFKYGAISCNTSMQCQNKICLHPDWRCNGVDECGDNSDERNCASVPIPPEIKFTGYSGTAFWLCVIAMMLIGVILGVTVPICYQKYKDSRYTRFRELSGIDG